MSAPYRWLHFQMGLPILATIPLPGALALWGRFTVAAGALGKDAPVKDVLDSLGPDFLCDVMAVLQELDPKAVRRLAMIASSSIEVLEQIEADPAKEAEALAAVNRMEPLMVVGHVLFFLGMRKNAAPHAPASSGNAM